MLPVSDMASAKDKRSEQFTARLPARVLNSLEQLRKLWEARDRVSYRNPELVLSRADVIVRLLESGLEGAWDKAGWRHQDPEVPNWGPSDAELKALLTKYTKSH